MKGHEAGDRYGYSREVLNEKHVISELRKLPGPSVSDLGTEIRSLNEHPERLEGQFETILKTKFT